MLAFATFYRSGMPAFKAFVTVRAGRKKSRNYVADTL